MAEQAVPEGGPKSAPVVIKKYANRRLYNTATSAYVTLEHLSQMVKDKTDFVVYDAKTGDEITRSVLTQIIFEEESKGGQTLLPIPFLRQLISFYGDSLQGVVPQYLEMSMSQFARNQEQMRSYLRNAGTETAGDLYRMVMNEVEAPLLREVLRHTEGNLSRAAELLGMSRATLRKKIAEHGL